MSRATPDEPLLLVSSSESEESKESKAKDDEAFAQFPMGDEAGDAKGDGFGDKGEQKDQEDKEWEEDEEEEYNDEDGAKISPSFDDGGP